MTEHRKERSRRSPRPRGRRKATSPSPNNSNLDAAILTVSTSSARLHMPYARESGDLAGASPPKFGGKQPREGDEPQVVVHACEESRAFVVPRKPVNSVVTPEESVEGRGAANGNSPSETRTGHSAGLGAPTELARVGECMRHAIVIAGIGAS